MDATTGMMLHRFFWIALVGLTAAVVAIVLLLRSGRAVPGPTDFHGRARPRHAPAGPRRL